MAILQRTEAQERSALIDVTAYDIALDLDQGPETFTSTSTVTFHCAAPGSATFLDLKAAQVHEITLNGEPIDPATVRDGRVALTGLRGDNTVRVRATMRYGHDGQGLHRAVDNADGRAYVYGMSFMDAAPQIFACFDQPDLKAPYDVRVRAPREWTVAGNGAATQDAPGEWTLATTAPMATYYMTVCAGPYATVRDDHDGIPLYLHARASLETELRAQADQMFMVTKQGFDYYHGLFGIRYPWGEYHQFFVPEFNAGAMENPGCVTLRDQYVFRGQPSYQELLTRSNTITHEMAHMWFGDLVSMKWWDDLWLNESFAEYMAHRTCADATEFTGAWVDMGIQRKNWGYDAERAPSTHPVAGAPAPDTDSALTNFDGIAYAKGASALRQLVAYLGDDVFVAGVHDYLQTYAYGNATLAQFLAAMEKAGGRSLDDWAQAWLRTAGADILSLDLTDDGGTITGAAIVRDVPPAYPADRPHVVEVAGFTGGRRVWAEHVELCSDRAPVPALHGRERPDVVVPNASDLTWATVALDADTLAVLEEQLPLIGDADARQVIWSSLLSGMARATVDPRDVLRIFAAAWPVEDQASLVGTLAREILAKLPGVYLTPDETPAATETLCLAGAAMMERVDPASIAIVPAARLVAATSRDEALLADWAKGARTPKALDGDLDFRWSALERLAELGLAGADRIDAQSAEDNTMSGALHALHATALRPDAAAKEWAWSQLTRNPDRSAYEAQALASGIFDCSDLDLVRPYVARYFSQIPSLADHLGEFAVARVAGDGFPKTLVEPATVDAGHDAIDTGRMTAGVRRAMTDQLSMLEEALRSRQTFAGGDPR